jgi:xanthine dehydrogenase accessory factor
VSQLLQRLSALIDRGEPAALAMVVGRRGSLPMSERAKLLVTSAGEMHGTVGGGCLEAEVYGIGRRLLETGGCSLERFDLTEVEDGLHGHVCGGSVAVLTQAVAPDEAACRLFARAAGLAAASETAVLASRLPPSDGCDAVGGAWVLVAGDEVLVAGVEAAPSAVVSEARAMLGAGTAAPQRQPDGDVEWFLEPLLPAPTVVVLGAGHCGRAIGELAATVGFRVWIADDRAPFLERDAMRWADEVVEVDFDRVLEQIDTSDQHYLVIVTRGHEHDLAVLRQALNAPSAYIGMIGSERKRHLFERQLREEGFDTESLGRVRSPMGLPIAADTPEEIAVAVVAEMIAIRRQAVLPDGLESGVSSRRLARRAAQRG